MKSQMKIVTLLSCSMYLIRSPQSDSVALLAWIRLCKTCLVTTCLIQNRTKIHLFIRQAEFLRGEIQLQRLMMYLYAQVD